MSSENEWNEKLCNCCDDCGICLYGSCCTPCLFGSNAEKIDDSNCFLMCCLYTLAAQVALCWLPHCIKRKKLREKYNLKEDPSCGDCLTTVFCGSCALCQEARELKSRGNLPSVVKQDAGYPPVVLQPGAPSNYMDPGKTQL